MYMKLLISFLCCSFIVLIILAFILIAAWVECFFLKKTQDDKA